MALVNYAESDGSTDISDDESAGNQVTKKTLDSTLEIKKDFNDLVEDEFKMRIPKYAKPFLQPISIKRKTGFDGKILLSIPTLEELDSSDDSDNEMEKKRKSQKSAVHRSENSKSLLDMLPPTQALIVRQGAHPMMVPHQVTKFRAINNSKKQPVKAQTSEQFEEEEEEFDDAEVEEEGEANSFFSFYDQKKEEEKLKLITPTPVHQTPQKPTQSFFSPSNSPQSSPPVAETELVLPRLEMKPFADSELPKQSSTSASTSSRRDDDDDVEEEPEPTWSESTFIPGPERKRARMSRCEVVGARPTPVLEMLASAKGRVKEVRQDDLTAGAKLNLIKSVTEDVRRRKPEAMVDEPGKLAFRKHQITWLAYKAQENEFELQDKWAEARRNQTASRAKYGF